VNFYFVDTHVNVTYTTISQLLQVLSTQQWLRWVTVWAQTWAENSGGGAAPLWGRARSPSNTMWPEPRSTFVSSGILIHPAVWPKQIWAENGVLCPFFGARELGFHITQYRLGRGLPPYLWEGELGPHLTQCGQGRDLLAYQVSS